MAWLSTSFRVLALFCLLQPLVALAQDADFLQAGYTDASYGNTAGKTPGTNVYVIDDEGDLYARAGITPARPGGTVFSPRVLAPALQDVSLGGPKGNAWGVSLNAEGGTGGGNMPFFEALSTGIWFPTSGGLSKISIGGPEGKVWGVNNVTGVYYRAFAGPQNPGLNWIPVVSLTIITDVKIGGPQGDVWALGIRNLFTGNRRVYYRSGISNSRPTGRSWDRVDGRDMATISVGGGFGSPFADGGGAGPLLSPGFPGNVAKVWGTDSLGTVYERVGITAQNPQGDRWQSVPSQGIPFRQVAVMGNGDVWGLSQIPTIGGFRIFHFVNGAWQFVSGGAVDITAF